MKYKAVIFDLDGVICSTDEYHYQAWKKMADSMGIYFDRTINNRLRGVSRMEKSGDHPRAVPRSGPERGKEGGACHPEK